VNIVGDLVGERRRLRSAMASVMSQKDIDSPPALKRKSSNTSADPPPSSKKKIRRTFKKLEIEGDGNCLFRAFSQHFNGQENEYEGVRHRIVKYVEKNWTQFQTKVESVLSSRLARSSRQYASYMGKDKTFGSEVEILAASLLYKTPIRVYLRKAKRFLPIYESGDLLGFKSDAADGSNVLYLEYDEDNLHYNVLVPIAVETEVLSSSIEKAPVAKSTVNPSAPPTPVSISAATTMAPSNDTTKPASPLPPARNSPVASPTVASPSIEPRVTPKALFINKTFSNSGDVSSAGAASPKLTRSASRETPPPTPASASVGNRGSRGGTPTRAPSSAVASPASVFKSRESSARPASSRGVTPIVVRDCYVPLSRTARDSRRSSVNAVSSNHSVSSLYKQFQRVNVKHKSSFAQQQHQHQPKVMALCLCSTRDPAFLAPVARAAKRHLSLYENMRKRQTTYRMTRMRASDGGVSAADSADGKTLDPEKAMNKTCAKDIILWPYLLHSPPDCPNEVFLYHLLFFLFAAAQDTDEAFTLLARYVFFLQHEEIEKYLTAYNLEFTSHDEETLQKILAHYRKSLKRDVATLRKDHVDMYFVHEEIDHPCRPTDLSSRQNCVIFILDSRHEEHQRLLTRLSGHLPYLWKRCPTPLIDADGMPTSISLESLNSIVDLAVDSICNDYVDSIVHLHPTRNSIEREIKVLTHHLAVLTDNSLQLSIYPKDSLLIDSELSSKTSSLFLMRDRLLELAKQSDDLLTFERQQIIGDRVADTHLLEAASTRYRVGVCLPTEEWVEASVFFEKALGDLLYSMQTSATNDSERGFLFLPALNRNRRPFHPFVDGAPLRRLAREAQYRVDIFTASPPSSDPVSIVLVQISKNTGVPKATKPIVDI